MKTLIFTAIWSLLFASSKALPSVETEACVEVCEVKDDPFRVDCDYFSIFSNGSWGPEVEGSNTFVFNVDANNDVMHYMPNGSSEKYRSISNVKKGKNEDGEEYQAIRVLSKYGNEFDILYFSEGKFVRVCYFDIGHIIEYY